MKKLILILVIFIISSCASQQNIKYYSSTVGTENDVSGKWNYTELSNDFDGSWKRVWVKGDSTTSYADPVLYIDTQSDYTVLIDTGQSNCTYGIVQTLQVVWKKGQDMAQNYLKEEIKVSATSLHFGYWNSDTNKIIIAPKNKDEFLWKLNKYDTFGFRYQPCLNSRTVVIAFDISGTHNILTKFNPNGF
tara:strand:- start:168 stop:737 length:570 start_codon:yes stop_codon:yes gene_type:complete